MNITRKRSKKNDIFILLVACLFTLGQVSNGLAMDVPEAYKHNLRVISKWGEPNAYLSELKMDDIDDNYIISLSNKIVCDLNNDYEKLGEIYQWVTDNIYYDYVAYEEPLGATVITELDEKRFADEGFPYWIANRPATTAVLRRGVCADYSSLMKYLLNAQGIPCIYITGYADNASSGHILCVEKNEHAWNAAYVDGRWVFFDATWDSGNKYLSDDEYCAGVSSQNYFDISLKKLSKDHYFIKAVQN